MNRLALVVAVLQLLEREPLRPRVDELAEALGATADEVRAALLELFDLAQAGSPPEGGENSE